MKKLLFVIAFGAIGFGANAQFKVISSGDVGIGTAFPLQKLHVKGNSCFQGSVGIGTPSPSYDLDVLGNGRIGSVIFGTYRSLGCSKPAVYSKGSLLLGTPGDWAFATFSEEIYSCGGVKVYPRPTNNIDICSRTFIQDIIRTPIYQTELKVSAVNRDSAIVQLEYVFLTEELRQVFPQLVSVISVPDTCGEGGEGDTNMLAINYTGMIPILTAGIQEQQVIIEQQQTEIGILQNVVSGQEFDLMELQRTVNKLQRILNCFCGLRGDGINPSCCEGVNITRQDTIVLDSNKNKNNPLLQNEAVLYQNTPNPFSSNTEISCYVPVINSNAFIYVYNLQGVELMSFPVLQTGISTVIVYASALPAGMYLYTLVVDGVIIDTKRMILTK